jgi:hypothetical protein
MKKRIPHSFSKLSKQKQHRLELQKVIKALRVMSNQPQELASMQAVVSADTVVVKLLRHAGSGQQANALDQVRPLYRVGWPKARAEPPASFARTDEYVDASIGETERAVRTLQRKPSSEVREFYKRLAKQNA